MPDATGRPIYRERLRKLASMFDKEVLFEAFRDDSEVNAFQVFSRLNKGGTSLSTGDVEAARLASTATRNLVGPMRRVIA